LCRVYRTAHEKKIPEAVADLKAFAFNAAPALLRRETSYYDSLVGTIAHTLRDLSGPRDGIAFFLNQIEAEPRWLRYNNQDGWARHAATLPGCRTDAKDLGDLEGRFLKVVLAELRRDLETRVARNRVVYSQRIQGYWKEKEADFARTAEDVLAQRNQSGASVAYIAEYLFRGIEHRGRAIEVLFIAHKRRLLDEAGQA